MNKEMQPIPGFENYLITKDGQVWSTYSKKFMATRINRDGYKILDLRQNGERKTCKIHRLLALTYIPNPNNKPFIDHINHNRLDNSLSNLRWVNEQENANNLTDKQAQTDRLLTMQDNAAKAGGKVVSKAVERRDKDNHSILYNTYPSSYQAAIELFGDKSKNSLINRCANGNKPSAYGYWWCFEGNYNQG